MVELITNKFMRQIKDTDEYTEEEIEEIEFGIATILLELTKTFILIFLAFLLNMGIEMLIFIPFIISIKKYSYGFHAESNVVCWVLTLILNLLFCFFAIYSAIDKNFIILLLLLLSVVYYLFAPADSKGLPLIFEESRKMQRNKCLILIFIFTIIVSISENILLNNIILSAVTFQALLISPVLYKIFNTPYRNYLNYKEN